MSKKETNVVRLMQPDHLYYAECVKCGSEEYRLLVSKSKSDGFKVEGTECVKCEDKQLFEI